MPIVVDVPECTACGCSTYHGRYGCCCDRDCKNFTPVVMDGSNPAYDALLAEANRLGRPLVYTSDLFRDWQATQQNGGRERFVWGLREHGTDLYWLDLPEDGRLWAWDWMRASQACNPTTRWYVWTGSRLIEVTGAVALSVLRSPEEAVEGVHNRA
jgi:hypothetical protein